MAALPYIQLFPADYLADTAHLNAAQHGAYLLLIMNYWQTGAPLKDSNVRLANVARMSQQEWIETREMLEEFFEIKDGEWIHHRIERDLSGVYSKSKNASMAGKASAEARRIKRLTNAATNVERKVNHTDTDTDTDTEKDQKHLSPALQDDDLPGAGVKSRSDVISLKQLVAEGCDKQHAKDWLAVRKSKKAPLTLTAWKGVKAEAEKAGITPAQAVAISAENGWQGFKASWASRQGETKSTAITKHTGFSERDYHAGLITREDGSYGF
ncbi:hypothetical protein AH02_42 [Pseudomonas phage AH02]|nr:hypothetical protein AH02_42 [Pseudomonas phage AH02]